MNIQSREAAAQAAPTGGWLLVAAAIVTAAFNMRNPVASIGPLLRDLHASGMSPLGDSVLTTLPPLCFGIAAFAAPALARRLGVERALFALMVLMTVGTAVRALPLVPVLFMGQVVACIAIGFVNGLLPSLVKRDFPTRVPFITGTYVMTMGVGTAVCAAATVPIAHWLGGWWWALGFWALPMLPAIVIWAFCLPPRGRATTMVRGRTSALWSDPVAWQVTLFMGLQSSLAYIVFGWLPAILRDRGLSGVDAGFMLSISVGAQAVSSLLAPIVATRGRSQSLTIAALMVLSFAALMGAMYAPLPTVWLWVLVLGLAQGASFSVALTVIVLRAADSHVASQLSGMAQGCGYLLASFGPLLAGLLHNWAHGWNAVAILAGVLAAGGAVAGFGAGRDRTVHAAPAPSSERPTS